MTPQVSVMLQSFAVYLNLVMYVAGKAPRVVHIPALCQSPQWSKLCLIYCWNSILLCVLLTHTHKQVHELCTVSLLHGCPM